jgi:hypothetical protein
LPNGSALHSTNKLQVEETMPSRQELAAEGPIALAIWCQRVADNPSAYSADVSEAALKLKLEWTGLQMPPNPNLNEQKKIEKKKEDLRRRMVEFLAGVL